MGYIVFEGEGAPDAAHYERLIRWLFEQVPSFGPLPSVRVYILQWDSFEAAAVRYVPGYTLQHSRLPGQILRGFLKPSSLGDRDRMEIYVLRPVMSDDVMIHEVLHFILQHWTKKGLLNHENAVRNYVQIIEISASYKEFLRNGG